MERLPLQISSRLDRTNGVDIAVSGDSQTVVYAAKPRKTQNQRLALCETLLPNRSQRQQV
jgi:antitoxin component of MazEF toxin-antitoxin module